MKLGFTHLKPAEKDFASAKKVQHYIVVLFLSDMKIDHEKVKFLCILVKNSKNYYVLCCVLKKREVRYLLVGVFDYNFECKSASYQAEHKAPFCAKISARLLCRTYFANLNKLI